MTDLKEPERHSWLKLSILLFCMLLYGAANVLGGDGDIGLNLDNPNVILLLKLVQTVSVVIIFILPAILFSQFWTRPKIRYLGMHSKPAATTLLLAGAGMLLALPVINWMADLNQHMQLPQAFSGMEAWMKSSEEKAGQLTEAFTKGTSVLALVSNLFVVAFMAAFSEEIFFRGIFQQVAIDCFRNKHVGVWFGAIIFSAFHMQFYGFFPRVMMGAFLGYLFLWSGSLWPGILAHFLNNGTAVFIAWMANRGSISTDVDKMGIQDGESWLVIMSAATVVVCMTLIYRLENNRKKQGISFSSSEKNTLS